MQLSQTRIDAILDHFREDLGKDLDRYHNHVYRVYNFCLLLDPDPANQTKYALAAAIHDLGLWTAKSFDYLPPTLKLIDQLFTEESSDVNQEELKAMINFHHKMSPYQGKYKETVETFRKADWIDVSLRLKRFDLKRKELKAVRKAFPNAGFHRFLIRRGFAYFWRHPLRPLPMFKK